MCFLVFVFTHVEEYLWCFVFFSIFSALSQFGILFLGVSFFSNSICQGYNFYFSIHRLCYYASNFFVFLWLWCFYFRNMVEQKREVKLKEDDILRLAKLCLPAVNFSISKMRVLFSGEPSMTLKVILQVLLLLYWEFSFSSHVIVKSVS